MKKWPGQLGYRMPAEWAFHDATWVGWPHNSSDWPGKLASIHWVYGEIVKRLTPGERVNILVNSQAWKTRVSRYLTRVGVDITRVKFYRISTDRGWTRDYGPLFLWRGHPQSEVAIAHFRFNGWARYEDWKKDCRVPLRVSSKLGHQLFPITKSDIPVVLEGGSIDVNGEGSLITTEECLLDPATQVRNPGFTKRDYEEIFRNALGAKNILWLGRGIEGDDTHGHVDDVCRFVGPTTVVLCQEKNQGDANYQPLRENRDRLEGMRLEDGSKVEVVPLPMPEPLTFNGRRLPASYANFYIANSVVLVPTFNDPQDRVALGVLGDLFPDRKVVGIHSVDLVWGFGTIHCLTQQQPSTRLTST